MDNLKFIGSLTKRFKRHFPKSYISIGLEYDWHGRTGLIDVKWRIYMSIQEDVGLNMFTKLEYFDSLDALGKFLEFFLLSSDGYNAIEKEGLL